ncbi:hypothetical protein PAXRUDRAFT_22815 [Paxillus rubicundulus Ve08.2h10]|uniref:Uncharacterized protein n=1 Tax=Paxillus rubicundulus Ve08.2h10 TaxID=930991 RepID=A0A0D0D4P1_9AGAM|nr:hypothetical protein PAXRUDRAFT_22815 [Paxillus rubicundulus Ve08.2h10]
MSARLDFRFYPQSYLGGILCSLQVVMVLFLAHHVALAIHEEYLIMGLLVMHMLGLEVSIHDDGLGIFPSTMQVSLARQRMLGSLPGHILVYFQVQIHPLLGTTQAKQDQFPRSNHPRVMPKPIPFQKLENSPDHGHPKELSVLILLPHQALGM